MIKLINYWRRQEGEVCCISKDIIGEMSRNGDFTWIYTKGQEPGTYKVKETPEEILAMSDIEEANKVIDWEQRRYEIAKDVMAAIYTRPNVNGTLLNISMIVNAADALIDVLKKGQDND